MSQIQQQPTLVGHRGYPAVYPENTLAGFRAALLAGAEAVECDIQFSRDGQPVVIHDPDLWRTARQRGRVAEMTAAELGTISAHEPKRLGDAAAPEMIPTLTELVSLLMQHAHARVFVEIKKEAFVYLSREDCVERVMAAVAPLGTRAIILSFDAEVLELARRAGATIGWVLKKYNSRSQQQAKGLSPDFLVCNYRRLPSSPVPLWRGPWQWFLYDIVDWHLAQSLAERGASYIETWNIGSMLESRK